MQPGELWCSSWSGGASRGQIVNDGRKIVNDMVD